MNICHNNCFKKSSLKSCRVADKIISIGKPKEKEKEKTKDIEEIYIPSEKRQQIRAQYGTVI